MTARIIVVTSGKGGVGKTTTSASFASGLARNGLKTVVIDFDVGLRNLDLIMGCERRVVYDFVNVINGEATLNQALIKDKHCESLFVLAASQTRDKDALTREGVERVIRELGEMGFAYIVCDSPAGIESSTTRRPQSRSARRSSTLGGGFRFFMCRRPDPGGAAGTTRRSEIRNIGN